MTCTVFGAGLVGSFLGAAARAEVYIPGTTGHARAEYIRLPGGERHWRARAISMADRDARRPLLVCTRVHRTPWAQLPSDALVAQNGMGQTGQSLAMAICFFAVDMNNGVLHATGPRPRVVVGPLPDIWQPTITNWREAGIEVEMRPDVRSAQWEKTILNATVGPLCLATGLSMGQVWADEELRTLTLRATVEGAHIARTAGIGIDPGLLDRATVFFSQVADHRPSMVHDPGELPWIIGALRDCARRNELAIPALDEIAARVAARLLIASEGRVCAAP